MPYGILLALVVFAKKDTMNTAKFEDRFFGADKPYIDLTPANQWGASIVGHIGASAWAAIEAHVAQRVSHVCELCGASESVQGVMGHRAHKFKIEMRFEHDEESRIAILRRLLHVCVPCSQAIHLRQTALQSKKMPPERSPFIGAVACLVKFHGVTDAEVKRWLATELAIWDKRAAIGHPENADLAIVEDGLCRLWR